MILKRYDRRGAALITQLVVATAIGPISAQGLSPIDFNELQPLLNKTIQLQRDVGNAGQGIVVARAGLSNALCFMLLSESLSHLSSELLRLQTLVSVAEGMRDPYDAQVALSYVKDVFVTLLKNVESDRPSVNRVPSNCPTNNFVAVKTQETLNLYASVDSQIRALLKRLDR